MSVAIAPAWGRRVAGAGRVANVDPGIEYQGTSRQISGLNPFVAGSGAPNQGIPLGRHLLSGEQVSLDPLEWLRQGWTTNPGVFVLGQPGVGKSAFCKRLLMGMCATGSTILVLGDPKNEYTPLVRHLGGQVVALGPGLDGINPLDAGPLGAALKRLSPQEAAAVRADVHSRRLSLLLALCALVRRGHVTNAEEHLLGAAVALAAERHRNSPTIPQVLALINEGPEPLRMAARMADDRLWVSTTADLAATLTLLCTGVLEGVFDRPTSTPIDLNARAVSFDISRIAAAGAGSAQLVAAAMLSVWAHAYAHVDATASLAATGLVPRRTYLGIMDELWRALRGTSGLVDHADSISRLSRQRGMATIMSTHSLDDLDALPTQEDRAKARGFIDRSAIKVFAALPGRELDRISKIVRLSRPEHDLVASWAASSFTGSGIHPGRGKYLIKLDEHAGIPVGMHLVDPEPLLYDTDAAIQAVAR